MNIDKAPEEIASFIAEALRVELQQDDKSFIFDLNVVNVDKSFNIEKAYLEKIINQLRDFESQDGTIISTPNVYETLVREESSFPRMMPRLRSDTLEITDGDNGINYCLSRPSNEYLVFLLMKVSEIASTRSLVLPLSLRMIFERSREEKIVSVFDLLRKIIPRFLTLRIESVKKRNLSELEKFSDAFLFQLSYNMDLALVPQRHLEEVIRTGRITRIRRSSIDDLNPPRRHYIPDLIYHYQLAVSADNPLLEFISYYHVAEHFFEMVFNEDLVLKIKDKLTRPDFSYKRKKDIGYLIKDISKSLQIKNETITISEFEALRLTIIKYVDLNDLKQKIDEYDSALIEYYRVKKVVFSDGSPVDLDSADKQQLARKLADRIYKTRNSIVHSKESEKSKYMPFSDDKVLVKEIPLLRFIAEQIIIGSSNIVA
ncbi:hypothetical protein IB680_02335 [Francisella philomiragia]|uniref:hypothetical protein n=1 Tax=Francisella philomiragia TaxID=28110 RepID=UPI0019033E0B|nr:hypothetical protein [Francisella philomiragia]MBK2094517.1 hypothetical protein [Francisella philomiragia]